MLGFALGTLCLFGLVGMAAAGGRRRHCGPAYAYAGGCGGGHGRWHHHHGGHHGRWHHDGEGDERSFRGRQGFERYARQAVKIRLGLDEDQEDIVGIALDHVKSAVDELTTALRDTRGDLGEAFRGETVDDARLNAVFEVQEDAVRTARKEVVAALKQAHAVLKPEQRAKVSEWLKAGRGPRSWV